MKKLSKEKQVMMVCLTGGPCAGKSSALSKLEEDLTSKGFNVFIIDEAATMLINGNMHPSRMDELDFQLTLAWIPPLQRSKCGRKCHFFYK